MEQKLKRVKRVEHLYERAYKTASGEKRVKFYAIFTCKLKHKRRVIPLGGDLDTAKEELAQILADNVRGDGKDFDAVNEPARQGITFAEWGESYFATKIDPEKRESGVERERRSFKTLKPHFGHMLLGEIKRTVIMEYRAKRLQEPVMRCGKAVMVDGKARTVSFPTVNRELAFLRYLLNLAEEDEIIEAAPRFTSKNRKNNLIKSEKDRKRARVAEPEEIKALLENMSRPAQRVIIALNETAMRIGEVLRLQWTMVDEAAGFIRLPAEYVKEKKKRTVPISAEIRGVLKELRAEQRKVPNTLDRVFTREGKPITSIRTAFEIAVDKAKINDLHVHDFRHTCITRWAAQGIPQAAIMAAAGHHSVQQNNDYTNINETHLRKAFGDSTPVIQANPVENQTAASY